MSLIFMTEEQTDRHMNNIVLRIEIYLAFLGFKIQVYLSNRERSHLIIAKLVLRPRNFP